MKVLSVTTCRDSKRISGNPKFQVIVLDGGQGRAAKWNRPADQSAIFRAALYR